MSTNLNIYQQFKKIIENISTSSIRWQLLCRLQIAIPIDRLNVVVWIILFDDDIFKMFNWVWKECNHLEWRSVKYHWCIHIFMRVSTTEQLLVIFSFANATLSKLLLNWSSRRFLRNFHSFFFTIWIMYAMHFMDCSLLLFIIVLWIPQKIQYSKSSTMFLMLETVQFPMV